MSFEPHAPIEIIQDKLYWISADRTPKNISKAFFINIDNDLVYESFHHDFGPLDIGKTVKFVLELTKLLKCPQFSDCKIYHHTSLDSAKRSNAAFLMGAFQIIALKRTAEEAWEPLSDVKPAFVPFRDALDGSCNYKCTILDCLKGLETAIQLKWFDIRKFDLQCYEKCGKVDLNWIIPGKMLAFSTPHSKAVDDLGDERFIPEDYVSIFRKLKVKKIIRLNSKSYDEQKFTQAGFQHHDLELQCAHCPGNKLIDQFLQLCDGEKGVIAVHCKSGLGYTGTMIACYAMKHYQFPAASLIGWMRLCRPGSILGKQQQFLIEKEEEFCPTRGTSETSIEDSDESTVEIDEKQKPYISKTPKLVTLKSSELKCF